MPDILPRYIRHSKAPAYLGMCREVFDRDVRPYVIEIPVGRKGKAYDRLDLDAWATHHKSRNGKQPMHGDQPWQQGHAESSPIATGPERSTRSTKASGSKSALGEPIRTKPSSASKAKSTPDAKDSYVDQTIALCLRSARRST